MYCQFIYWGLLACLFCFLHIFGTTTAPPPKCCCQLSFGHFSWIRYVPRGWSMVTSKKDGSHFHVESMFHGIHNCRLKACVAQTCVTVRQGGLLFGDKGWSIKVQGVTYAPLMVAFPKYRPKYRPPNFYCWFQQRLQILLYSPARVILPMKGTMQAPRSLETGIPHLCQEPLKQTKAAPFSKKDLWQFYTSSPSVG